MNKAFQLFLWENEPSVNTPLGETLLNKVNVAVNEIDNRVLTLDTKKANQADLLTAIADVTFDEKTGIITFTKKSGAQTKIDTKLEKLAVNFKYDTASQNLIITLEDGSKQYVDMRSLITELEFLDSDTVLFSVGVNGDVTAHIAKGSITEEMIDTDYKAKLELYVSQALSHVNSAKEQVTLAEAEVDKAKAEVNNAKAQVALAEGHVNTAKGYATDSSNSAKLAESYTHGKTGARAGEDTDNAKYYMEQAKAIAGGDVADLIDGTTPVGNALALGGESAYQWQTKLDNIQTTGKATLSTAGWYRVAEISSNRVYYDFNSLELLIERDSDYAWGEFIKLRIVPTVATGSVKSCDIVALDCKGKGHVITKARYTDDGTKCYVEIYVTKDNCKVFYLVNNGNGYTTAWKAITPTLTSETVDGVTTRTTYDIPASVSPVTDLDLVRFSGEQITTSILEKALEVSQGHHNFVLGGAYYTGGDLPSATYAYGMASIYKRSTDIVVIVWGRRAETPQVNCYHDSKAEWLGWKKLATTADLANYATKEELEDILLDLEDGNIATGDAAALGGQTATEWQTKIDNIQTSNKVTLTANGWYRVALNAGADEDYCKLVLCKSWFSTSSETHIIECNSTYSKKVLTSLSSNVSGIQTIKKVRFTKEGTSKYLEFYYENASTASNPVRYIVLGTDIWRAITAVPTSETVDGVTVLATCDLPANARPATDLDLVKKVSIANAPIISGTAQYTIFAKIKKSISEDFPRALLLLSNFNDTVVYGGLFAVSVSYYRRQIGMSARALSGNTTYSPVTFGYYSDDNYVYFGVRASNYGDARKIVDLGHTSTFEVGMLSTLTAEPSGWTTIDISRNTTNSELATALANYLPIGNSDGLTTNVLLLGSKWAFIEKSGNHVNLGIKSNTNGAIDNSNMRYLQIMSNTEKTSVKDALLLADTVNGNTTQYNLLHSGNYSDYALPKTGGTASGQIMVEKTEDTESNVRVKNPKGTLDLIVASNGTKGIFDRTNGKWIAYGTVDGTNTFNGTASENLPLTGGTLAGYLAFKKAENGSASMTKSHAADYDYGFVLEDKDVDNNNVALFISAKNDKLQFKNVAGSYYDVLHKGNVGSYALPISGGTINGGDYTDVLVSSNSGNSTIRVKNPKREIWHRADSNGYYQIYDKTHNKDIIISNPDGTTTFNGTATNADTVDGKHAEDFHTAPINVTFPGGSNIEISFSGSTVALISMIGWNGSFYASYLYHGYAAGSIRQKVVNLSASGSFPYELSETEQKLIIHNGTTASGVCSIEILYGEQACTTKTVESPTTYPTTTPLPEIYATAKGNLPLSGGTVTNNQYTQLRVKDTAYNVALVGFDGVGGVLGYLGFDGVNYPVVRDANGTALGEILHGGNFHAYATRLTDFKRHDGTNSLNTSILEKALEVGAGVHRFSLAGGTNYTATDLPDGGFTYSTATIYKRNSTSIVVELVCEGFNYTAINSYNGYGWTGWGLGATKADLAKYLPLSGGTVNGAVSIREWLTIYANSSAADAYTSLIEYDNATHLRHATNANNYDDVTVRQGEVVYQKLVNGAFSENTLLHTGNSAKVAIQSTAPTDTSALWVW